MASGIIVSAATLVLVNSTLFGRVSSLNYTLNTPQKEIRGVDILVPLESTPVACSLSGTISIYRLRRDGGVEAAGMIPTWDSLTRGKYFSLTVIDRRIDNVIFQCSKCSVTSQNWGINPKGMVIGSISFNGIDYINDSQAQKP